MAPITRIVKIEKIQAFVDKRRSRDELLDVTCRSTNAHDHPARFVFTTDDPFMKDTIHCAQQRSGFVAVGFIRNGPLGEHQLVSAQELEPIP